jgi:hypothetical protein
MPSGGKKARRKKEQAESARRRDQLLSEHTARITPTGTSELADYSLTSPVASLTRVVHHPWPWGKTI